ncbi:MAG TPA: L,D-transpeptidase family protein [Thermoanaerobaculia bacterium]|nr:L,D-transpeptidase family protein [Thermoanaerobaculia bacterium]
MRGPLTAVILLAGVAPAAFGQPATIADPPAVRTIREIVTSARHPDLKWPAFPYYRDEMQGLYEPRAYVPLWLAEGKPIKQARDVLDVLADSARRGLDPEEYDVTWLEARWRELQSRGAPAEEDLGRFDAGLTLALLRQISDVHIGRITPSRVQIGLDPAPKKYDLVALVRQAVEQDRIRATVEEAEPQLAVYRRIKEALAFYRGLAGAELPEVPATATVRPGDAFAGLPALRARLTAFGDLQAAAAAGDAAEEPASVYEGSVYEGETVDAVRRFQERHGLAADGVLGKATLAALAVPPAKRLRQIEIALERLRWVPDLGDGPLIAVNIPAFQLWAFDSLGTTPSPALTMRVVVGKSFDSRTPVFLETMEYVVFRPYWNVPPSIVRGELLPALRRDPDALAKRDMEIVRGSGDATALAPTPDNVAQLAKGALKVRQRPGPRNALGLAKFIFPNTDNVYLHGTPAQSAFARVRRDLSHGCVRLEDPAAIARFVLQDQSAWTPERIRAAMAGEKPQQVNLQRKIPVLLFYSTALVDLDGRVLFYEDIYGHDARLERELASAYSNQP